MAYPANIAFTFATQTGPIPLSELDTNLTNLQVGLNGIGNGTSVLTNVNITGGTLSNVTISGLQISANTVTDSQLVPMGALTVKGASGNVVANAGNITMGTLATMLNNVTGAAWVPTDGTGAGLVFTGVSGTVNRVNNVVIASATFTYPSTNNVASALVTLPVQVPNQNYASTAGSCGSAAFGTSWQTIAGANVVSFFSNTNGSTVTNAGLSGLQVHLNIIYPAS